MYTEYNYKYMCIMEILKTNMISLNERPYQRKYTNTHIRV